MSIFNREPKSTPIAELEAKGLDLSRHLIAINKVTPALEHLKWIRTNIPKGSGPLGRGSFEGPFLGEVVDHQLLNNQLISEDKSVIVELRHQGSEVPQAVIVTQTQAVRVIGRASGDALPTSLEDLKQLLDDEKKYRMQQNPSADPRQSILR